MTNNYTHTHTNTPLSDKRYGIANVFIAILHLSFQQSVSQSEIMNNLEHYSN